MLDYTTIGKSKTATILVDILNSINKPKLTRKVVDFLNSNFYNVKRILEIPDTATRLRILQLFYSNLKHVVKVRADVKIPPLGVYKDPMGKESDATKEITDRMFALIYEKIKDGIYNTKQLKKDGIKHVDERWQPMETAPRDGNSILLFTKTYGIVEAWFAQGEWHENHEGREYSGSFWICADDKFQIEVEEYPYADSFTGKCRYDDGEAKAWMHKPADPILVIEVDEDKYDVPNKTILIERGK